MDLNIKAVTGPERRLQTVISELDTTISDLLDKADFSLTELMEVTAIHADDTPDDRTHDLNRACMLADIAYDYISRAQSTLTSLILRESRESDQRAPGHDFAECRQEIIKQIQQIRNPELLKKILAYVEAWTDDKGEK